MYYSNKKNGCGHYKSSDMETGALLKKGEDSGGCAGCLYFSSHNCGYRVAKLSG